MKDKRLRPGKTYRNFRWLFNVRRRGLLYKEIAKICGISLSTIYSWAKRFKIEKYINQRRYTEEYNEWRRKVFERDGYRCVKCRSREHLHAHHIKPWDTFPELRLEISNGQTLCEKCHANIHPWMKELYYGKSKRK